MEESNEKQDLISELRVLRDLAIVYACINLASRNAKISTSNLKKRKDMPRNIIKFENQGFSKWWY